MRASVEEYWNMAAILGYAQHPSRREIQIFLRTTSIINFMQFKKKTFSGRRHGRRFGTRETFSDDVNDVESA